MPTHHPRLGPQKNVITLEKAKEYTHHWRHFVKTLYSGEEKNTPHGVFIPFTDIFELSKLQKEVTHIVKDPAKDPIRIYIVGVRSYYCLKTEMMVTYPISAAKYPVESVLVAVYQTNHREPGPDEYNYNPDYPNYDLIIPVPSINDKTKAGDAGAYSIYDITQPCPNLCDLTSSLY